MHHRPAFIGQVCVYECVNIHIIVKPGRIPVDGTLDVAPDKVLQVTIAA
jgi:hypothetical protein